jgi:hypothetical protein
MIKDELNGDPKRVALVDLCGGNLTISKLVTVCIYKCCMQIHGITEYAGH